MNFVELVEILDLAVAIGFSVYVILAYLNDNWSYSKQETFAFVFTVYMILNFFGFLYNPRSELETIKSAHTKCLERAIEFGDNPNKVISCDITYAEAIKGTKEYIIDYQIKKTLDEQNK